LTGTTRVLASRPGSANGTEPWDESRFGTTSAPDFEAYYPPRFADERTAVLSDLDRHARRQRKRGLLERVRTWIREEPDTARAEFQDSARDIEILQHVETDLSGTP